MRQSIYLVLGLLFWVGYASAQGFVTEGGHVACTTMGAFNEIIDAAIAKNNQRFYGILNQGKCILTKKGIPIQVVERVSAGVYKVRITTPDGSASMLFFTPAENVKRTK